jgi:hypothetical protein
VSNRARQRRHCRSYLQAHLTRHDGEPPTVRVMRELTVLLRPVTRPAPRRSVTVDSDNGIREFLWGFLGHVVADADEDSVRVLAREFISV